MLNAHIKISFAGLPIKDHHMCIPDIPTWYISPPTDLYWEWQNFHKEVSSKAPIHYLTQPYDWAGTHIRHTISLVRCTEFP